MLLRRSVGGSAKYAAITPALPLALYADAGFYLNAMILLLGARFDFLLGSNPGSVAKRHSGAAGAGVAGHGRCVDVDGAKAVSEGGPTPRQEALSTSQEFRGGSPPPTTPPGSCPVTKPHSRQDCWTLAAARAMLARPSRWREFRWVTY